MSVTARQAWVGLLILFLVVLLVLTAAVYWQHGVHLNALHFMAFLLNPYAPVGC